MTGGSADAPAWKVVLDANILLQAPIRDTILRLAEAEVLAVYWSDEILAEVERNFSSVTGHTDAARRTQHLLAAIRSAFTEAAIYGYEDPIPILPIALHDRHVLACAITAASRHGIPIDCWVRCLTNVPANFSMCCSPRGRTCTRRAR